MAYVPERGYAVWLRFSPRLVMNKLITAPLLCFHRHRTIAVSGWHFFAQ